jgi:methylmalonyl-CoA mutase
MLAACDEDLTQYTPATPEGLFAGNRRALARFITALENGALADPVREQILAGAAAVKDVPVLGITGTGGAGKSSLTDELIRRFRFDRDDRLNIAILAIDPSRRKSGGALLGDRIRMNAIHGERIYMRSLATRSAISEVPQYLRDLIAACKVAWHRPGRCRYRAAERYLAVRHDAGVRCRFAAGKDRHARFCRSGRDQ